MKKVLFVLCALVIAFSFSSCAKKEYKVGDIGPAGGYIFYDCDADNTDSDPDGEDNLKSDECGWRYLEAAPADLRVVNGVPTVDVNTPGYEDGEYRIYFGLYAKNLKELDNMKDYEEGFMYVNGNTEYNNKNCTGTVIGTGKKNTQLLVKAMGNNAVILGFKTTKEYAAKLCDDLECRYKGKIYSDWFLPSRDELNLMYINLKSDGLGDFEDSPYWSSSEYNAYVRSAWDQRFQDGGQVGYYGYRERYFHVRPIRAF